jgi:hypothetical protein
LNRHGDGLLTSFARSDEVGYRIAEGFAMIATRGGL